MTSHAKTFLMASVWMAELKKFQGKEASERLKNLEQCMKLIEFSTREGSHTTNWFWTLKTVYITNRNIKIFYVGYSSSSYLNGHYQQVWQGIPWNIWIPLYLVIPASRHCFLVQCVGLIINKIFCELFFNMVQL